MSINSLTQFAWWKTYLTPKRYSHNKIPDLTGKVAIVTGANSGLGYATTVALAANGARVFLACRSRERAQEAIENARAEIKAKYPKAPTPQLEFLELDLNDMTKSSQAAQEFLKKGLPLHILVNNSGIMNCPYALSADGIETQFAVNHMGYPLCVHYGSPRQNQGVAALQDRHPILSRPRDARSKLANVLFGKALARRLANEKVWVNVAHPGYVATNLSRSTKDVWGNFADKVFRVVTKIVAMSPRVGALTQLYLATSPEIESKDIRGRYFIPIANEIKPIHYARDVDLQEALWVFSEKLAKEKIKA
ncbi:hypothetical protein BGZ88_001086 [Linnemannia elongata]|nr:hypothetical protein BGZ88_001086 [Linnemannia elongata]